MRRGFKFLTFVAALALVLGSGVSVRAQSGGGGNDAEVTESEYEGEPAQGAALSQPPELGPLPDGDTHEVRLDAVNRRIQIADGEYFTAWTFGGTVPGPTLHIEQGDRVDFTMANRSELDMGMYIADGEPHSMDFHAARVAPSDEFRGIEAGEQINFTWEAEYPGVFLYHCMGTAGVEHHEKEEPEVRAGVLHHRYEGDALEVLEHIAHGMFGAVIVQPEGGWPNRADREIVLVQNEWYAEVDVASDYEKGMVFDLPGVMDEEPRWVAFNARANQYIEEPLRVEAGDRVRLYLVNAGPSDTASVHVIGSIFDTVYRDGNPANELTGLQTVPLPAAGGAVAEFTVPEPGTYKVVDHEFTDAAKGAVALIEAE